MTKLSQFAFALFLAFATGCASQQHAQIPYTPTKWTVLAFDAVDRSVTLQQIPAPPTQERDTIQLVKTETAMLQDFQKCLTDGTLVGYTFTAPSDQSPWAGRYLLGLAFERLFGPNSEGQSTEVTEQALENIGNAVDELARRQYEK